MMSRKRSFSYISLVNFDLQVASVHIQCQATRHVFQRVYALVHTVNGIGSAFGDEITFSVGSTESEHAVFFRCKEDRRCSSWFQLVRWLPARAF